MYNIDEKIKSFYKNIKSVPIISDDEEEKKKKKTETFSSQIENSLKNFESQSNLNNNKSSVTDELGLDIKSDEEFKKIAEDLVDGKYDIKETNLKNNYQLDAEKINDKVKDIIDDGEKDKNKVIDSYSKLNEDVINKSIKQGISRSSIIKGQIEDLNLNKLKEVAVIDEEVSKKLSKNSLELEYLQKEYENAVSKLDLERALEIKEKFESLKANQEKEIENAIIKREEEIKKQEEQRLKEEEEAKRKAEEAEAKRLKEEEEAKLKAEEEEAKRLEKEEKERQEAEQEALEKEEKRKTQKEKEDKEMLEKIEKEKTAEEKNDAKYEENYYNTKVKENDTKLPDSENINVDELNLDLVTVEFINNLSKDNQLAVKKRLIEEALKNYFSKPSSEAKKEYENDKRLQELLGEQKKIIEGYLASY